MEDRTVPFFLRNMGGEGGGGWGAEIPSRPLVINTPDRDNENASPATNTRRGQEWGKRAKEN